MSQVSQRLGVSVHSLYEWRKKDASQVSKGGDQADEIRQWLVATKPADQ